MSRPAPNAPASAPRMPVLAAMAALSPRKSDTVPAPKRKFTDWAMI